MDRLIEAARDLRRIRENQDQQGPAPMGNLYRNLFRRFDLYQQPIGARRQQQEWRNAEENSRDTLLIDEGIRQDTLFIDEGNSSSRDVLYIEEEVDPAERRSKMGDSYTIVIGQTRLTSGAQIEEEEESESSDFSDEERDLEIAKNFKPWHCPK